MTQRVLLMTGSLGPGGTELAVMTLARGLAERGRVEPLLCLLGSGGDFTASLRRHGVTVHELGISGRIRMPGNSRRLNELGPLVAHHRIRIVHTFLFDADYYGMKAARRGRPWGVITTRRAIKRGKFFHLLGYRLTNRLVDKIICNSEAVKRFTLDKEGASPSKVLVIPNGVDLERFTSGNGDPLRKRLGVGEGELLIGTVGTIKKVKGQAVLIEAVAPLLQRRPGLKLVLAGEVTRGYGDDLRRRVEELGLDGRVLFPGVIQDIPDLLAGLDLFVLPSLSEGMSNALLEAMAAGKPIVATGAGGSGENLDQGRCGLVVPPGDAAALGGAIEQMIADPDRRSELGARAARRAHEEYTLPRMFERTERVYAELIDRAWNRLLSSRPEWLSMTYRSGRETS